MDKAIRQKAEKMSYHYFTVRILVEATNREDAKGIVESMMTMVEGYEIECEHRFDEMLNDNGDSVVICQLCGVEAKK